MKAVITILKVLFLINFLSAQGEAFSENELKFKDGYDALLSGNASKALKIFEFQIFENENYDAIPYYRAASCAVTEKESPTQQKLLKVTKKAVKAGNSWGAALDKKEFPKVFTTIRDKADSGNAVAQYTLASAYYYGNGIEKNPELSYKYIKMASDQGMSCAQFGLGTCYAEGFGVEKDYDKAVALIEKSIEANPRKNQIKYLKKLKKKKAKN